MNHSTIVVNGKDSESWQVLFTFQVEKHRCNTVNNTGSKPNPSIQTHKPKLRALKRHIQSLKKRTYHHPQTRSSCSRPRLIASRHGVHAHGSQQHADVILRDVSITVCPPNPPREWLLTLHSSPFPQPRWKADYAAIQGEQSRPEQASRPAGKTMAETTGGVKVMAEPKREAKTMA